MRSKILVFQLAYPLTYHLLSIKPVSFLLPRFYIYHWPLRFLNHDYICFKFSEDVFDRGTLPEARLTIYVPWYNLHWTTCVALVPSSSFSFPRFFLVSLCIWLHFSFSVNIIVRITAFATSSIDISLSSLVFPGSGGVEVGSVLAWHPLLLKNEVMAQDYFEQKQSQAREENPKRKKNQVAKRYPNWVREQRIWIFWILLRSY